MSVITSETWASEDKSTPFRASFIKRDAASLGVFTIRSSVSFLLLLLLSLLLLSLLLLLLFSSCMSCKPVLILLWRQMKRREFFRLVVWMWIDNFVCVCVRICECLCVRTCIHMRVLVRVLICVRIYVHVIRADYV